MGNIPDIAENIFVKDRLRELRDNGHTKVYGYHIEEMAAQSDLTLYRLFRNMYRARQAGRLEELVENYLAKLEK